MRLVLASVGVRRGKADAEAGLVEGYLERARGYAPCVWESYADEERLLAGVERQAGRTAAVLAIFDSRGRGLSSEEFAGVLRGWRDGGKQQVVLAVGPASGWSEAARARADLQISLGRMTLPHALAQVVVAEQMYRALTILAGHPYHCGH